MVRFTGKTWDIYQDEGEDADDGDVWLQAKLDNAGRAAIAGRHANHGYSGWFVGFIQAKGGRRRFLSWRIMFPDMQNGYEIQAHKADTIFRIEECLKAFNDMEIGQVKGGWRFTDEAEAERRALRHWEAWNAPRPGITREEAQETADRLNNAASRVTRRRYTADDILARSESDFEKRMRLHGNRLLGIQPSAK